MTTRRFIFLNHATPEDNIFTLWLGVRLSAAGYDVWSDLLQLIGGERAWKNIDEAIRQHAAIFLPIISSASINTAKEGVHNEIAIATEVRRSENLDNFVVPIRLEPVSPMPPQLIQLTYIDFTKNWADGFSLPPSSRNPIVFIKKAGTLRSYSSADEDEHKNA